MQIQNKYIGDDKMQKMLSHYHCEMPLNVVKLRFAGAVCSPHLELRPSDVISSLWPAGAEPRLQTKEEAELFFKFFMGLWDEMYAKVSENKVSLPALGKLDSPKLTAACHERFEQIEQGFVEGFWGGQSDLKIPAYIAEILDSLSDLAALYPTFATRAATEKDLKNLSDAVAHTDKLVNRSLAFIIENFVQPRMENPGQKPQ